MSDDGDMYNFDSSDEEDNYEDDDFQEESLGENDFQEESLGENDLGINEEEKEEVQKDSATNNNEIADDKSKSRQTLEDENDEELAEWKQLGEAVNLHMAMVRELDKDEEPRVVEKRAKIKSRFTLRGCGREDSLTSK